MLNLMNPRKKNCYQNWADLSLCGERKKVANDEDGQREQRTRSCLDPMKVL
jgi:predicted RNA-binding Zn ribbon-like protein